ncbi:hypothetical protein D3C71_1912670 [compost metagenome]
MITQGWTPLASRSWPWPRPDGAAAAGTGALSSGLTGAATGAATLATSGLPPVSALSESLANAELTRAGPLAMRLSSLPILARDFFTLVSNCSLVNGLPTKSETPA